TRIRSPPGVPTRGAAPRESAAARRPAPSPHGPSGAAPRRRAPSSALPLLELLEGLRPVATQELRQRAVREELPTRLARRAVVGFVLGVDDPLDRRAAVGARLPVSAVHGHALAERRDLLRKRPLGVSAEALDPLAEDGARRPVEARDLLVRQAA